MLRRFGEVSAVEPDETSRRYAAEATGLVVQPGYLPDGLPKFRESFDLVAALDLLEHVEDDGAAVAALAALVKPGGFILATVPACPWMWSDHDAQHHHKRRYRIEAFRRIFRAAGLHVRRASHFNTLLFPLIAAARITKAVCGGTGADDEVVPGRAINRLLTRVFASEQRILNAFDLPFGVSILLLAQRPLPDGV
jgi:2-polyprenyl-3-methyl-5-hydroxy-6-metoxy-1,4-benzoquinol methylase